MTTCIGFWETGCSGGDLGDPLLYPEVEDQRLGEDEVFADYEHEWTDMPGCDRWKSTQVGVKRKSWNLIQRGCYAKIEERQVTDREVLIQPNTKRSVHDSPLNTVPMLRQSVSDANHLYNSSVIYKDFSSFFRTDYSFCLCSSMLKGSILKKLLVILGS